MASTAGVNLAISGLASGMDWQSLSPSSPTAERSPETQWEATQTKVNNTEFRLHDIKSYLSQLETDVDKLKDPTLYDNARPTAPTSVATAASSAGGTTGYLQL